MLTSQMTVAMDLGIADAGQVNRGAAERGPLHRPRRTRAVQVLPRPRSSAKDELRYILSLCLRVLARCGVKARMSNGTASDNR